MKDQSSVKGLNEALKTLSDIGRDVVIDAETGLLSGAMIISNEAKTNSPYISGNLRRSIHVQSVRTTMGLEKPTDGTPITGVAESNNKKIIVLVGTNVVYARPVEYRKPYLRPAADMKREDAEKEVVDALKALIKRYKV